jgi:hypothetical protein
MKRHSFTAAFPRLRNRREEVQGKPVPRFPVSISDVPATEAPPTLVVNYGSRDDDDAVTLRRYGGRLYVAFGGTNYWNDGPRQEIGASIEDVRALMEGPPNAFLNALSPSHSQYRNRQGPILGEDRSSEIASKAESFLFIDGRLHRRVEEPVWWTAYRSSDAGAFARPEITIYTTPTLHPSLTVRFDRPEVATALVGLRHERRRECRIVESRGSVDVLDLSYVPSYDVMVAMARVYGESAVRKIEPELPHLDRGCAEAFATMCAGIAGLDERGHEAAVEFCDGFSDLCGRLLADRRRVPSDLRHWLKEKTQPLLQRVEIARAHEAEMPPAPRP